MPVLDLTLLRISAPIPTSPAYPVHCAVRMAFQLDRPHQECQMKLVHTLSLVLAAVFVGTSALAAQADQHPAHHPAGSASAPAAKAMPGKARPEMAQMDSQMKSMQEMHDKMMAAKTPEERSALMAEQMKTMQNGMTMMNGMSAGAMGGMKGDMAANHQMMEKRMEMMQAMMQMMMDRLPAEPAK